MYYEVAKEIFDKMPNAYFGAVAVRGLDNTKPIAELEEMLQANIAVCEQYFAGKKPKETPDIVPYREAFRALDINPNKFLCSIEALLTRIAKGKGFPHINPIVDLGNAVSIKYHLPIGAHDLDTISDGLEVRLAREGDTLAEAARLRKPVVVLKAGKSAVGAKAAASHTGNLAGSKEAYHAVFRKYGVVEVDCLEELLCMAQMFSVLGSNLPAAAGIAGLNLSGGANTICADLCEQFEIPLPPLQEADKEEIRKYIPVFATPNNPLDATTALFGDVERTVGLLRVFEGMEDVGGVTIGCNIDITEGRVSVAICEALMEARKRGLKKPYFVVPSLEASPSERYKALLEQNEIVVMSSAKTAYRCLALLMEYTRYSPQRHDLRGVSNVAVAAGVGTQTLTEYEAKQRIGACGVCVGEERVVANLEELRQVLPNMKFPLVMKVSSKDILHKTDCGGVRLNIQSAQEAEQAFMRIMGNSAAHCPQAHIEGVLVGTMAPKGVEMILGVHNDAQFGPMLLAGLGGVFVELFRDVVLTPCPISHEEAEDLLTTLKSYRLLSGYRGDTAKDVAALADLMVQISRYAVDNRDLRELDLNPVFVYDKGEGVRVIDALMLINA